MTAQIAETLTYKGKKHSMFSNPLEGYFSLGGKRPDFANISTALWRGYVGEWEIIDDRLYIINLNGTLQDGEEASLETIFPGFPDRVFAHWFTGKIRIPQGNQIKYVHMGYGSEYESDLFIRFEKGIIIEEEVVHNGESDSTLNANNYGPAGFTVFPRKD